MIYPKVQIIWHNHYGNNISLKGRKFFALKIISLFFKAIINVNEELLDWSKKNLLCRKSYYLKNFPFFDNLDKFTDSLPGGESLFIKWRMRTGLKCQI